MTCVEFDLFPCNPVTFALFFTGQPRFHGFFIGTRLIAKFGNSSINSFSQRISKIYGNRKF